jgi:hypothetical protein
MSYRQQIIDQLTSELPGLRKDPGLDWLDKSLVALDGPATNLTTKAFLSAMGNSRTVMGFLLEVRVATICLSGFPANAVRTEVQEGTAKSPCDVTVKDAPIRLDIQCKAMQSVENELHIDELANWLEEHGNAQGLKGLFDLQVVSRATEEDLEQYRQWQQTNWQLLQVPALVHYPQGSQDPLIEIETHLPDLDRDLDGAPDEFASGIIWGPVDNIGLAATEDIDRLRGRLIARIKEGRKTLGFVPGINQGNLIAIDLPSLGLTDEDSLVDALYGEQYVEVPSFKQTRKTDAGLFSSRKFEYISGIVLLNNAAPWHSSASLILYPHPKHIELAKKILAYGCFRLPLDSKGRSLIGI